MHFAENMVNHLEDILENRNTNINRYLSQREGILLVRCLPADRPVNMLGDISAQQGDRIFEVNADVRYHELQSIINQKFDA